MQSYVLVIYGCFFLFFKVQEDLILRLCHLPFLKPPDISNQLPFPLELREIGILVYTYLLPLSFLFSGFRFSSVDGDELVSHSGGGSVRVSFRQFGLLLLYVTRTLFKITNGGFER